MAICFIFGARTYPDSTAYINSLTIVSPFYPLLLDAFELVFGPTLFIEAVAVFQNLLAAYCVFSFIEYLWRAFRLNLIEVYLLAAGFVASFAAQTLFTVTGIITTNAILTEGITLPLYFLLFKYLLISLDCKNLRPLIAAAVICFIITNTRGQLYWLAFVTLGISLYVARLSAKPRGNDEKPAPPPRHTFIVIPALLLIYLAASFLFTHTYNYIKQGEFVGNQLGRSVVLSAVIYNSDAQDSELFADGSVEKAIFDGCYGEASSKKLTYQYAGNGLFEQFGHYERSYDPLKRILRQTAQKYASQTAVIESAYTNMIFTLIVDNAGQFFHHYAQNAVAGFARSIALFSPVFLIYAALAYAAAIAFIIVAKLKRVCAVSARYMLLCLICIASNVLFTSFGVFCLSRYMVYNLPVFYAGVLIAAHELIALMRAKSKRLTFKRS